MISSDCSDAGADVAMYSRLGTPKEKKVLVVLNLVLFGEA